MPALVSADTVTGEGQMTSGGSATTGGGGGGAGVGALGVLLHPAQHISARSVRKTFIVPSTFFSSSVTIHKFSVVHSRVFTSEVKAYASGNSIHASGSRFVPYFDRTSEARGLLSCRARHDGQPLVKKDSP